VSGGAGARRPCRERGHERRLDRHAPVAFTADDCHSENVKFDKERLQSPSRLVRVIVLTADQVEDFEPFVPYFRFMEEGLAADVAAPTKQKIMGENRYDFGNVDLAFDEVELRLYEL
jgi:hypothetical protein